MPPSPSFGIAIAGAGHSGSTLLGLVLGSHSACFYAGEAKKSLFLGDERKPLRKRVCKLCGEGCPVWGKLRPPFVPDLDAVLSERTGRPVIVDSSKDLDWINARAEGLAARGSALKVLLLARDGRAVVASRRRKYGGAIEGLIDEWVEKVETCLALVESLGGRVVRYETLVRDPASTLSSLTEWLGISFEPAMLGYERFEHHPLGGNTGTQSVVARASAIEAPLAAVPERSRDFYEGLSGGFRHDLRYLDELSPAELQVFDSRAGALGERFRWDGAPRP